METKLKQNRMNIFILNIRTVNVGTHTLGVHSSFFSTPFFHWIHLSEELYFDRKMLA
ncbi:hypothetical protein LEP1GSC052_3375 [Leptospira kmetyi serovar Malaysia str. Bejo-Iso9]|nr:hypothetical protein LEP1GSC052_3375 [Leptospira kmetyi serovar Malaysia str. Bejo-Iso9]